MKHLLLRNAFTLKALLLVSMIVGAISGAWAQTYKLEKVTSVAQNGLYVFEQDGYVMKGSVSSSALQTTNSYKTSDLSGTENYVWKLVYGSTSGSYYQIFNVDTKKYITNSSSTNITLGDGSHWAFNFQEDGTVLIQNKDNSDRFLGYTNATSHAYKAYATSNLSSSTYPHAINVYQLVAEGGAADESVATSVTIDATGITNTDVYTGTDAGIFTASVVSAEGNVISDATVTWASQNTNVATIDASTGEVTLVAAGTTVITASYAGVEGQYKPSSNTYTLIVTDSTPFAGGDVTFVAGTDLGTTTVNGTPDEVSKAVVTMSSTDAAFATAEYRLYKNSQTTFTTSVGKITQIVFTCTAEDDAKYGPGCIDELDGYSYSGNTGIWIGRAESVTFTAATNQVRATQVVVTVDMSDEVGKKDPELSFSTDVVNAAIGVDPELPTLNTASGFDGNVEYSSSDETVAIVTDVEAGDLRILKGGSTTITATFAGNDNFTKGSASYTLNVSDNRLRTTVSYGPIELDIDDVATLTRLAPVVIDAEGNIVEYSYDGWPTEMSFVIVSDDNSLIGSIDNNTGEIILNKAVGTATLKAQYNYYNVNTNYQPSECTFTITVVDPNAPGGRNNPYSVAEAIDYIGTLGSETSPLSVYVSGIVSTAPTQTPTANGELSYYISDDGAAETQLQVYKGKGVDNAAFTAQTEIQVGDEVTVVGKVKMYKTTPEFDAGNYLVSLKRKQKVFLSFEKQEYTATMGQDFEEPTLSVKDESGADIEGLTITYSFESFGNLPIEINDETGVVTLKTEGEATVIATFAGDDEYKPATASYKLTVMSNKTASNLAIDEPNSTTLNVGDKIQLGYTSEGDGTITWKSSNEAVMTVDQQGNVTAVAVGKATITATQSETESCLADEASIELTVEDPNQGECLWLLSEASYSSASADQVTWTSDYATMDVTRAEGGTAANNYLGGTNNYTSSRFYLNSTLTITPAEGYRIASVLFQATTEKYATAFQTSTWTNAEEVVISGEKVVTITPTDGMEAIVATIGGTCGFDKVQVSYVKIGEVVIEPSITITPDTYIMDAKAGGGELPVVSKNLATDPQLEVVFVEADGVTPATYDWITAEINDKGNIDGQILENTGDARTAYFYVQGVGANGKDVKSNLVTFNQEAPVTEPTITVNTETWEFEYNGGAKTFGFEYANLGSEPTFSVQFFESDGTTETACGWITTQFEANDDKVTITPAVNDGTSARTAYFKIYAVVNEAKVYSNLVTISQKANSETPQPGSQYLWYLSEASYDSNASAEKVTWSSDFATMVVDKAGSTTPANNYLGGDNTSTRFYKNSTLTITRVVGYRIASVLFQATTEGYAKTFKNSTWTNVAEAAISGENSVVLTPTDGMEAIVATIGGTCGFDKVQVTYVKTEEVVKQSANLAFAETSFSVEPEADFTAPKLTTAEGFDGTIVYSSTDDDIALVDETTGEVLIGAKEGVVTITATSAETENFKAGSASYTITVKAPEKAEPEISFAEAIYTVNIGEEFTAPALINPHGLTVTYSCDNVEIALVDETTGDVVLDTRAKATVTISAYFAGDETYKPAIASYTIKIVDPTASTTIYCAFVTEYDGKVYAVNNTISSSTLGATEVTIINGKVLADDNIIWKVSEIETEEGSYTIQSKANDKYLGYNKTSFSLNDNPGSYTWTYDAAAGYYLNSDGSRSLIYGRDAAGFKNYATSNVTKEEYSAVAMPMATASGCTRTLSNTWGTVCFDHQVLVENTVNARFYWVAGKVLNEAGEPIKLMLREEDMSLKTGYPFIVEAIDPTAPVALLFEEGEVVENALNMDGLYGTFTGTSVPEGAYVLSGGNFVKCGTGCSVGPNRAYLNMEDVPVYYGDESGVKVFNLGGEDGISSLDAAAEGAVIYDLSGRRVSKTVKGLYIVNGKKVSVK